MVIHLNNCYFRHYEQPANRLSHSWIPSVAVRRWQRHPSRLSYLAVRQAFRTQLGDQPSPLGSKSRSATDVPSCPSAVLNALPGSFLDQVPFDFCESSKQPYDQRSQLSKPRGVEQSVQSPHELAFGLESRETSDNLTLSSSQTVKLWNNKGVARLEGLQSFLERFTPFGGDCAAHLLPEHGVAPSGLQRLELLVKVLVLGADPGVTNGLRTVS